MEMSIFYILIGFVLLVLGGGYLVKSSVGLSFKFNLSKMIIGMTVVSFATSAPELIVSLSAALNGSTDMALSNVIGSNVANIALVLGVTSLISAIYVDKSFFKMNWPVMMFFSFILFWFLKNDLLLSSVEGIVLFALLIIFIVYMIWDAKNNKEVISVDDEVDDELAKAGYGKIFVWLGLGAVALYFGSDFLVKGAKDIASSLGVSEGVIGLTVVAIGTSVPELAASIIAALKGEKAISLGNLIGSNIFNIGSVLGLTAIISPLKVNPLVLQNDIYWMLGVAFILLPISFIPKKYQIGKLKGSMLFIGYAVFIYLAFV